MLQRREKMDSKEPTSLSEAIGSVGFSAQAVKEYLRSRGLEA
jgi:hypothetical protein